MTESEAIETLIGIRRVSGYSKSREEALDMAISALEKQEGEGGLTMAEYIEREAAVAIIEEKQKELCPLGRYSRTMVYGSDRDRFDSWQEIINSIEDIPAADVVEEENILKFYYVRSIDEYWIGQRIDNFYYAEYDSKRCQWVWTHSRHLPWGEHVVSPTSLWKEHTYPSEPEEVPFAEWLQGFIKKHAADAAHSGGSLEYRAELEGGDE